MTEFDESRIINALHTNEAVIGKKYFYSDELINLRSIVGLDTQFGELIEVDTDCFEPFVMDNSNSYQFLYPYEEPQEQRMTYIQLMEWLAKGNGLVKYGNCDTVWSQENVHANTLNDKVEDDMTIRSWDSDKWVEPTVDIYERDCKGGEK